MTGFVDCNFSRAAAQGSANEAGELGIATRVGFCCMFVALCGLSGCDQLIGSASLLSVDPSFHQFSYCSSCSDASMHFA